MSHYKSTANGNTNIDLALLHFLFATNLLLNFGAIFPGGFGYFAPEKRFHINSKGNSFWCYMSYSTG
jgi:hypothetical protein